MELDLEGGEALKMIPGGVRQLIPLQRQALQRLNRKAVRIVYFREVFA